MRRALPPPTFLVAAAAAAAAVGAAASYPLWPRDAHAQGTSSASTIYVPWEGLVFRTPDGRAIARLSRDTHGGLLELYGDRQEGAVHLSPGAIGASHSVVREPYALDDDDPWTAVPPPNGVQPAIGF